MMIWIYQIIKKNLKEILLNVLLSQDLKLKIILKMYKYNITFLLVYNKYNDINIYIFKSFKKNISQRYNKNSKKNKINYLYYLFYL